MDREEFAVACYLARMACQGTFLVQDLFYNQGNALPPVLPKTLVPESKELYYNQSAIAEKDWASFKVNLKILTSCNSLERLSVAHCIKSVCTSTTGWANNKLGGKEYVKTFLTFSRLISINQMTQTLLLEGAKGVRLRMVSRQQDMLFQLVILHVTIIIH